MLKLNHQIPLDKKVPESTTLIKLTQKYGPEMIAAVNNGSLHQLTRKKILKGKKLRMDSAVTPSNIHYPTASRKSQRLSKRSKSKASLSK